MAKNEAQVEVVETLEDQIKAAGSKSALIRKLAAEGMSRGAIAKHMNIRYQHVRNVLITPIKKA
jgi:hypothetical protein